MAFNGVLVKLAMTFFPLLKEYFGSAEKRQELFSVRATTFIILFALVICTCTNMYLAEQARNNLELHEPIVKQYNVILEENGKLKGEIKDLQEKAVVSETRVSDALNGCKLETSEKLTYTYDPKTSTMVPVGEIKK